MPNNVFISWSGTRAKAIAQELYRFLPDVIHRVSPWLSSADIDKGTLWRSDVAEALRDLRVGIICLTPENIDARWILFEAGALSKTLSDAHVCPYLLDLDITQVASPLADFNMTKATKDDTFRLVKTLNVAVGGEVAPDRLERTFERFWPDLEKAIKGLEKQKPKDEAQAKTRPTEEILEELVARLRGVERRVEMTSSSSVEGPSVASSLPQIQARIEALATWDRRLRHLFSKYRGTTSKARRTASKKDLELVFSTRDRIGRELMAFGMAVPATRVLEEVKHILRGGE